MTSRTASLLVLALAACNTAEQPELELYDGDAFGRVAGHVLDTNGDAIEGVLVQVDGFSAVTDDEGFYKLEAVTPGQDFVVSFERAGFTDNFQRASLISWETVGVNATLKPVDGVRSFQSSEGGLVTVDDVDVEFLPDSIMYEDGTSYDGPVNVEVTYFDPYTDDLRAAPGDLSALARDTIDPDAFTKEAVIPAVLVSYGMVEVNLSDDSGEELQLKEDMPATVDMPLSNPEWNAYQMAGGDRQFTWSFDGEIGKWVQEADGVSYEDEEDGDLRFRFEASHFSTWNCDMPMTPTCAQGCVYDYLGFPVRGAKVEAAGTSNTIAYTDEDGCYEISVLAGDTVTVNGSTVVADRTWEASGGTVSIDCPAGDHFCEVDETGINGECVEIPDINIPVCRESGIVMVDNLTPVADVFDSTISADQLRAWFWEPKGDTEYCDDPWDDVPEDDCIEMEDDDVDSVTVVLEEFDTHSVGDWVEFETPQADYLLDASMTEDGDIVYFEETMSYTKGITPVVVEETFVVIEGGDDIVVTAPGSPDDYFGPMDHVTVVTVPEDVVVNEVDDSTGDITIDFDGANNEEDIIIVVTDGTDGDDGDLEEGGDDVICRADDDGSFTVDEAWLENLESGFGSVTILRPTFTWVAGPDGLPIRIQAVSGTVFETEF